MNDIRKRVKIKHLWKSSSTRDAKGCISMHILAKKCKYTQCVLCFFACRILAQMPIKSNQSAPTPHLHHIHPSHLPGGWNRKQVDMKIWQKKADPCWVKWSKSVHIMCNIIIIHRYQKIHGCINCSNVRITSLRFFVALQSGKIMAANHLPTKRPVILSGRLTWRKYRFI